MLCAKCGHEIMNNAAFCPFCGQKVAQGKNGPEEPIYQTVVKGLLKSGSLMVYRDRTEFVTSSVQKAIFSYKGLVSVKKGWDSIEFLTEDGRTESCPASRKNIHEAFLYIEKAVKPYLARRKERLLSQGVRYSFPSSMGLLNDGLLNISEKQVEFKAKSGKTEIISFQDVKSVSASAGTLDLVLFGEKTRSFAISKELKEEAAAFVAESIAPCLARRKESLLAQGIYFSFIGSDGGVLNILADRVEYKSQSGQTMNVFYPAVRAASLRGGILELAMTDGTSKSFSVDEEDGSEILAFVNKAIEPYVAARTVGFDKAFGIDERIEINEERGVFHIIRQGGREITEEYSLDALTRCEWTERRELNALGSVVSGSIALFKSAAKAAGNQNVAEAEERISCAGVVLTLGAEDQVKTESIWFGIFTAGMSRTNKKYERYLAEWTGFSDYLRNSRPDCELLEPAPPEQESLLPEIAGEAGDGASEASHAENAADGGAGAAAQQDELGIAKYIEGVSRFICNCGTPMTIAFQGNRGNGEKGSVLRMLFNRLEERYGNNRLWINARQFYQGEAGGDLPVLVGKKLAGQLSDGGNAADILANLAGLVTGAIVSDSSLGKEMVRGLLNKRSADSIEELVELFEKMVETRSQGENGKVVFFIDGLDRLTPEKAVELLEAMRDFFDCSGCVFVVAVDYNVVLSGVQKRCGQGFEESRGKSFFDEIFKMSFRVPAFSFNIQSYVKGKLEHMDIRPDEEELELYASLAQTSVGRDPGSIDRLIASFQLLKSTAEEELYESRYKRLALFALLCMQTRFREIYDYAVQMRESVTPEFLAGLCGEALQPWSGDQAADGEREAFQDFGSVLARIIDKDGEIAISEEECRDFAEVLEISGITSK